MGRLFAPNAPLPVVPPTEPRKSLSLKEKVILFGIGTITVFLITTASYSVASRQYTSKLNKYKQEVSEITFSNPYHDLITGLSNNLSSLEIEKRMLLESPWSIARNKKMKELDIQIIETIIETDKVTQLSNQTKVNIETNRLSIIDNLKNKNLYPF